MKGLDIRVLEIFIAAVEEKSLSRAAVREDLVTSAASKRVADLERHLGHSLLLRHGRGVEPTPAGTVLYQRAKAIVRSIQLAEKAVSGFSSEGTAKIRLAANPSTLLQQLPSHMGQFLHDRRDISVDLIEAHSFDIPRMVADTTVDIGIYHANHPAPGVTSFPFATDRVGLVVPIGHPLSVKLEVHLEEALDYDLLGYFPQHSLERFLSYIGQSISRPPTVKLQVSNFETRCRMIKEGLGIGIVPEQIAENYLKDMGLVLLQLLDEWAKRKFFICVHDPECLNRPTAELLRHLRGFNTSDLCI